MIFFKKTELTTEITAKKSIMCIADFVESSVDWKVIPVGHGDSVSACHVADPGLIPGSGLVEIFSLLEGFVTKLILFFGIY